MLEGGYSKIVCINCNNSFLVTAPYCPEMKAERCRTPRQVRSQTRTWLCSCVSDANRDGHLDFIDLNLLEPALQWPGWGQNFAAALNS